MRFIIISSVLITLGLSSCTGPRLVPDIQTPVNAKDPRDWQYQKIEHSDIQLAKLDYISGSNGDDDLQSLQDRLVERIVDAEIKALESMDNKLNALQRQINFISILILAVAISIMLTVIILNNKKLEIVKLQPIIIKDQTDKPEVEYKPKNNVIMEDDVDIIKEGPHVMIRQKESESDNILREELRDMHKHLKDLKLPNAKFGNESDGTI